MCAARASSIEGKRSPSQALWAVNAAASAAAFAFAAVLAARTVDLTSSAAETAELASDACHDRSLGYEIWRIRINARVIEPFLFCILSRGPLTINHFQVTFFEDFLALL